MEDPVSGLSGLRLWRGSIGRSGLEPRRSSLHLLRLTTAVILWYYSHLCQV